MDLGRTEGVHSLPFKDRLNWNRRQGRQRMESRKTTFLAQFTEWTMKSLTQIGHIKGELDFKGR